MKDEPNIISMFGNRSGHHNTELRKRGIEQNENHTPH